MNFPRATSSPTRAWRCMALAPTYPARCALAVSSKYAAADGFAYTAAPVIDSHHRNRMVRGEPARYVRVQQGVIKLPPDFSGGYAGIFTLQDERPR
jgi:hypothetical protein